MRNIVPPLIYCIGVAVIGALGGTAWILFSAAGNLLLTIALLIASCTLPWLLGQRAKTAGALAVVAVGWLLLVAATIPAQAVLVGVTTPGGDFLQILGGPAVWVGTAVVSLAFWIAVLLSIRFLRTLDPENLSSVKSLPELL